MGEKKLDEFEKKLQWLRKQKELHKGDWITQEIADAYFKRAQSLPYNGRQDIGERRQLRVELQEKYGLLELEAVNIINGFGIKDCVNKYYCIKNEIIHQKKDDNFETWLKFELKKENIKSLKDVEDWNLDEVD